MKWKLLLTGLLILAGSVLVLAFYTNGKIDWGESASFGQGKVQTFVTLDGPDQPGRVGVYFTEGVLSGLPAEMSEIVLDFPASIETTPLTDLLLTWNPHGHEPPGVYDLPHFDFHFYTVTDQERAEIEAGTCTTEQDNRIPDPPGTVPVTCEVFDRAMQPLPADMVPPDYDITPGVVPDMGNHLIDFTGPEFNGQSFTHTWIYGAYEGKLTFYEPMIAADFLARQEDVCRSLKTPQAMPQAGWYPTEYCIEYLDQEQAYTVSVESFRWFEASDDQVESPVHGPADHE